MAEITSDVFDIFHPTPVPLRDLSLSAIVISLEIWRCEIDEYRSKDTLKEFHPDGDSASLKTKLIPDLPSVIYSMIDKYVIIFGHSINFWLWRHYEAIFYFDNAHRSCVLELFEDFVCDYDGAIHYERTAQRMMHCDRFDVHQKFLIACTYCFEDDIRRIGPHVLEMIRLDALDKSSNSQYIKFIANTHFSYWIFSLTNSMRRLINRDPPLEEELFDTFMHHNRPSLEYFWNLIPSEKRVLKAIYVFTRDLPSFVRFILPKLDDQQLVEFVHRKGCELLFALLKKSCYDEEVIFSTWMYVKHAMDEIAFADLIVRILQSEIYGICDSSKLDLDEDGYMILLYKDYDGYDDRHIDDFLPLCFVLWNSAPGNWKRAATRKIASDMRLFDPLLDVDPPIIPLYRKLNFLLNVLSYATFEERNAFWRDFWHCLIMKTHWKDLHEIMRLCLRDEDEIAQFKNNVMANHEKVRYFCKRLLRLSYFDELDDFVSFLWSEMRAARNFKRQLLRSVFLGDGQCCAFDEIIKKPGEFNEFINDAYNNVDMSMNFKNQLMSSPEVRSRISDRALLVPTEQLVEFFDTFVSTEENMLQMKACIIDALKNAAANRKSIVSEFRFTSLLSWCLGSDEEVAKFKMNSTEEL